MDSQGDEPIRDKADDDSDELTPSDDSDELTPSVDLGGVRDVDVPQPVVMGPIDLEREKKRGLLAVWSFGLFTFTVLVLTLPVIFGARTWNDLQGLATSVLPVVVGVVGTTTGFYFGTKSG
jgi:hypothetical protein